MESGSVNWIRSTQTQQAHDVVSTSICKTSIQTSHRRWNDVACLLGHDGNNKILQINEMVAQWNIKHKSSVKI